METIKNNIDLVKTHDAVEVPLKVNGESIIIKDTQTQSEIVKPSAKTAKPADDVIAELKAGLNKKDKNDTTEQKRDNFTTEEIEKKIVEVGDFSALLQPILLHLLRKSDKNEQNLAKEITDRKHDLQVSRDEILLNLKNETTNVKQIIKKETEERQRDMKDIEEFVKKENAERKTEVVKVIEKIRTDEEERQEKARSLEDKIAREKRELEEYLKKEALEHKKQVDLENKALKEKLDREAAELKKRMSEADEEKAEEMKIIQTRNENERKVLQEKIEREKAELAEEMEKAEQDRKNQAEKLQNKLEEDRKEVQNGIVKMFERMKGENDNRKNEIHGLKDILVRENDRITQEQATLRRSPPTSSLTR